MSKDLCRNILIGVFGLFRKHIEISVRINLKAADVAAPVGGVTVCLGRCRAEQAAVMRAVRVRAEHRGLACFRIGIGQQHSPRLTERLMPVLGHIRPAVVEIILDVVPAGLGLLKHMPPVIVCFIGQPQIEHALRFDVSVLPAVLGKEDAAGGRPARREHCCREQHPFFPVMLWLIVLLFFHYDFGILSFAVRSLYISVLCHITQPRFDFSDSDFFVSISSAISYFSRASFSS